MNNGTVKMFTDGGYRSSIGIGACAFVAVYEDDSSPSNFHVSYKNTTSNRMELRGAIEALKWARRFASDYKVIIVTDSQYLKNIPEWAVRWRENGWKTANKKDVKNKDLVNAYLIEISKANKFSSEWVPGHSGDVWNEHVDLLVNIAIDELDPTDDWRDEYQYGEGNEV